ncbi:hypothetical protein BDW22DRAFT_1330924 [Trametopsis cervina]|nr:hypothetical protein BDW22DRAFT_1330924 [Trametopsis cervina]
MENPHAERQNMLLQRIIKNADKCTESIAELNICLEEIVRANEQVKIAADLVSKYRQKAQFNLEVTRGINAASETNDPEA